MSIESIYSKLTDILREVFDDDSIIARPDLAADHVVGWDSFAHLRLILAVEREFCLDFTADEIASVENIGELGQLVHARLPE